MANTQINITQNGTKTLKTAGKYCDRDIDINVNVEDGTTGITPTGTKEITSNGMYDVTNYANANVAVPNTAQPTQFTNIMTHGSTEFTYNQRYDGTARDGAICVIVDLAALGITATQKLEVRMRGLLIDLSVMNIMRSADKTSWSNFKMMVPPGIDDHGDLLVTISSLDPTSYPYLLLPFRNSTSEVTAENFAGAILTINEPIGNGGYVG